MTPAERYVLGAAMLDAAAYWRAASLVCEDDFTSEGGRKLWDAITRRMRAGKSADAVTMGEVVPALAELAMDLAAETYSTANIASHAEIVKKRGEVRRLQNAGRTIAGLSGDNAFTEAQRLLAACQPRTAEQVQTFRDGLAVMVETLRRRMDDGEAVDGLSWGIPELDGLYRPEPGHLCIVAARPKVGKTALVQQLKLLAAQAGKRVFEASLEMSLRELTERAVSHVGRLPLRWIKHPKEAPDEGMAKVAAGADAIHDLPLVIDDNPNVTPDQVVAKAMQLHMANTLGLVVVDHIGLFSLPGKARRDEELGAASKAMKGLAKTLNVPVILVCQLNRGSEHRADREPQASDLRDSGRIEEDADAVVMLHRDDKNNPGLARVFVRMNRHGEQGDVTLDANLSEMRFEQSNREWAFGGPARAGGERSFASRYGRGKSQGEVSGGGGRG